MNRYFLVTFIGAVFVVVFVFFMGGNDTNNSNSVSVDTREEQPTSIVEKKSDEKIGKPSLPTLAPAPQKSSSVTLKLDGSNLLKQMIDKIELQNVLDKVLKNGDGAPVAQDNKNSTAEITNETQTQDPQQQEKKMEKEPEIIINKEVLNVSRNDSFATRKSGTSNDVVPPPSLTFPGAHQNQSNTSNVQITSSGDNGNVSTNQPAAAAAAVQEVTTEKKELRDLLPWMGDASNPCCASLRRAATAILSVPSDIESLLPILSALERESDIKTVVELGSRLGSSTITMLRAMSYDPLEKKFATADLQLRQPILAMYRCERICSSGNGNKVSNSVDGQNGEKNASLYANRTFFSIEGNDMLIDIPFVDKNKAADEATTTPYRPIDFLFIDTLHHAALLTMELKRYPRFVRKFIAFHDSFSFYARNEGPHDFVPPGWPQGRPIPVGLHAAIKDFLLENPEWVEEMNNVNNNGLFIIRRRSVAPNPEYIRSATPRYSGFAMEPQESMQHLISSVPDWGKHFDQIDRRVLDECNQAYDEMYSALGIQKEAISPPCLVAPFSVRSFAAGLYSVFLRAPDDQLPLATHLGVLAAQVAGAIHTLVIIGQDPSVVVWGCELSVMVAAAHGSSQARKESSVTFVPHPAAALLESEQKRGDIALNESSSTTSTTMPPPEPQQQEQKMQQTCPLEGKLMEWLNANPVNVKHELPVVSTQDQKQIDLLIVSAEIISKLSKSKLSSLVASVKHRIVVYGTSLYSMKLFDEIATSKSKNFDSYNNNNTEVAVPNVFELKLHLARNAGVAMWERKQSYDLLYVPEAKKKYN